MFSIFKPRAVKQFIISNKGLFLLSFVFIMLGMIIGAIICINEQESTIFASATVSLEDIIVGDFSAGELFFSCFKKILLASIILFVFSLTKITSIFNYIYLAYQGMLVAMTATNLILTNALAGLLNVLLFTAPVNLINMLIIAYASSLFIKRREYQKVYKKSFMASFSAYSSQVVGLIVGIVVVSLIYGVIYPLLLKSIVVISY